MKKTIIVLGSARSGTSIVAGIIHRMGINMNPLHNPVAGYPFGSFEDSDFTELIVKLWNEKQANEDYQPSQKVKEEIRGLIAKRKMTSNIWGWKCALTHRVFSWFMPYLENPYFIIIARDIFSHADSFKRMQFTSYGRDITYHDSLVQCSMDMTALIKVLKIYCTVPQFFITHQEVCSDPGLVASNLSIFLDVIITPEIIKNVRDVYIPKEKQCIELTS